MRIWGSPAHREFCQASPDGSQNPAYYRATLSLQLAHQLHLLAAKGRPKTLADCRANVSVGPHFKDGAEAEGEEVHLRSPSQRKVLLWDLSSLASHSSSLCGANGRDSRHRTSFCLYPPQTVRQYHTSPKTQPFDYIRLTFASVTPNSLVESYWEGRKLKSKFITQNVLLCLLHSKCVPD